MRPLTYAAAASVDLQPWVVAMNDHSTTRNLFADLSRSMPGEQIEPLLSGSQCTLERIVSLGHVTPEGQWYDQPRNEWVVLLSGRAILRLSEPAQTFDLKPGDWIQLPAHCRHRVEWTDPDRHTVWLALHYEDAPPEPSSESNS